MLAAEAVYARRPLKVVNAKEHCSCLTLSPRGSVGCSRERQLNSGSVICTRLTVGANQHPASKLISCHGLHSP